MNWRLGLQIAIWFLIGVLLYTIIKNTDQTLWDLNIWQLLEAIGTWILVAGVVYAALQFDQARKSTQAQLAVDFFQRFKDEKGTLGRIYELKPEEIKLIGKERNWGVNDLNKNRIDSVLDMLNMIGGLRKQGILDKSLAIGTIAGAPAIRCWYKLNGYIKEERSKRGYVLEYYEDFAKECLDYFDEKHVEVYFYEKGTDGTITFKVNLVEKLKLDQSLRPRSLKEIQNERDC